MEGHILAEKYEITRMLGRGGMGAVYEARNHLGKRLAVKLLLNPELARDPALVQRFFREAKASAAIESEHIVEVYDTGVDPQTGFPFIVMEMLKGEDLEHTIQRVGALNPTATARVISQAADGLAEAHAAGIVHRDIKPANVFMTMRGPAELVVKILDFGIAKQVVEQLQGQSAGLTKTGSMLGTPLYMSPEQARGLRTVDARSDIWSLGVCLYEALSGHTPWGSIETLGDLILAICTQDITPLHEAAPWVPRALSALVHRALARDPQRRTPTCRALIDELAPFTGGALSIAPDLLTGVAEEHRRSSVAPRLAQNTISGAASMTSSQVRTNPGLTHTGQRTLNGVEKNSRVAMYAGIGLAGLALAVGGSLAVAKMLHRQQDPSTMTSASSGEDPVVEPPPAPPELPPATPNGAASVTELLAPTTSAQPPVVASVKPPIKVVVGTGIKTPPVSSVKPPASTSATIVTKPPVTLKASGETCSADAECASQTCLAGRCSRKITSGIDG